MDVLVSLKAQLDQADELMVEAKQLCQQIIDENKTGVLFHFDGQIQSIRALYVAQLSISLLNDKSVQPYLCFVSFMGEEQAFNRELIEIFNIKQPVLINVDDALDELVLEVEYSYKRLGMSRHMEINSKARFKAVLKLESARAMAADMNLLCLPN